MNIISLSHFGQKQHPKISNKNHGASFPMAGSSFDFFLCSRGLPVHQPHVTDLEGSTNTMSSSTTCRGATDRDGRHWNLEIFYKKFDFMTGLSEMALICVFFGQLWTLLNGYSHFEILWIRGFHIDVHSFLFEIFFIAFWAPGSVAKVAFTRCLTACAGTRRL